MWRNWNSHHFWWERLWKMVWQHLIKSNTHLPAITLPFFIRLHPIKMKCMSHRDTYSLVCTTALFVTALNQERPKCPSVGGRISRTSEQSQGESYLA